jgi:hypothetical protein
MLDELREAKFERLPGLWPDSESQFPRTLFRVGHIPSYRHTVGPSTHFTWIIRRAFSC